MVEADLVERVECINASLSLAFLVLERLESRLAARR